MAAARPYFKKSIAELEAIYAAESSNLAVKRQLLADLEHRSTERATSLMRVLQAELQAAAPTIRGPAPSETPPEARPATNELEAAARHLSVQRETRTSIHSNASIGPGGLVAETEGTVRLPGDRPSAILSAWTALEALSPQTYRRPADLAGGDSRCVVPIDEKPLPWLRGEHSRPKYLQIVPGCVPVDRWASSVVARLCFSR